MKRTRFRLLSLAAAVAALMLVSCAPVRDRRTLDAMEALMPERPDSALAVLRGLQPRDLPGLHVRPLHALLLSEALDKNYIDLTDDSLALAANHYYGEHGTKLHRLKSWYYLGRIRFNSGNYAEASICYNKAIEYAEALTNYHYLGLINREIANAYTKVWDNFHAIQYIEKSIAAFDSAGEQRYSAYCYLALARLYRNQKQYDNSNESLNWIFNNSTEDYLIASAYELKALNLLSEDDPDLNQVKESFSKAHIGTLLKENAVRLANLAFLQQLAGIKDSADYYINKAAQCVESFDDSLYVTFYRYRVADSGSDSLQAKNLLEDYLAFQDPAILRTLEQSVSFYQGNYYYSEARVNALKARIRALSYGLVIVLLTVLVFFLLSRNRRQKAMIIEEMSKISEIRQDLYSMSNEKEEMGRMVATLFENRLRILQTLSEQYDIVDESHQLKMRERGRELSRDEIVSSFRDKMRELRKDKDINLSIEEALNVWKDGIMKRFRSVFGVDSPSKLRMSEEDFELAPYYFSGMKQKTISYLTGYTEHAIKERKHRIKQKIEALDDSFLKEKELFLSNL